MSFIQQFFTSRDNNANAETFVGQEGRLWFDPVTNQIYSSDGNTPGGIPLAGGGGGNGTPGGLNGQVQFNQAGSFGGTANLTINSATGALSAVSFIGNGAGLTSITGANVTGTVADAAHATVADSANAVAGGNVTGNVSNATHAYFADVANSVAGANVTGTVANATYATSAGSATTATTAGTANAVAGANVSGTVANATYALSANSASSLVNGSSSVILNSDGTMVFPNNNINSGSNPITLWSTDSSSLLWRSPTGGAPSEPVQTIIEAGNGTATITVSTGVLAVQSQKIWTFDTAGNTTFPDATVQTTAYPGTATALSLSGNVTGGNLSTPGILDFTSGNAEIGTINSIASWYYESSFNVASQDSEPRGVFFKPDGTRMYVVGQTGDDINQYDLGTAWDITTAVYGNAFLISGQGITPYDVSFKSDGTAMYMLDGTNDAVYQYTLSGAWDVGTASYASKSFSVTSQESAPTGMWFKPDGTKFYITGTTGDDVNEYNLGTAWDISTASFLQVSVSLTTYETGPEGLCFSADGTKMWIVGPIYNRIIEFSLSTPWNVSTIAFVGYINIYGSGPYGVAGASGLFVDTTAGVAYVSDYQNDRIFQYATDVSTGQFYGPQWTAQSNFNVGNNLSVNQNFSVSGAARAVGSITSITSVVSPNIATTTSSGTTSLITGTSTGTLNFATGITSGTLNEMTAQTTGNYTLGGTGATGAINIGRSTANQSIVIGNGVTASGSVKTINIGTLGASGSNTNVTIGSVTAGAVTTTTIYGNITTGNLTTTGLITATGNITGGNVLSNGQLSTAGNITGGNITVGGTMTAVGNISASWVTASYYSGTWGTNFVSTGNVSGTNISTAGLISATGNITGGNVIATTTVYGNAATAFVAGSAAISGVALQMPQEGALRNLTNGLTNMYFDVSIGGSTNGQFQFRSSNAFTNVLTMSPTAFNVNTEAVVTARTASFGRLPWNSAIDTELTIDDYRWRITNSGGIYPQVISNTGGTKNSAWTAVAAISGSAITQGGSTGILLPNNSWTTLYTFGSMASAGDTVTVTFQDKNLGRIYRITFMRSDNGSTAGYNIIAERLL